MRPITRAGNPVIVGKHRLCHREEADGKRMREDAWRARRRAIREQGAASEAENVGSVSAGLDDIKWPGYKAGACTAYVQRAVTPAQIGQLDPGIARPPFGPFGVLTSSSIATSVADHADRI